MTIYKFFNQLTDSYCHIFVKKIVSYCLLHIGHMLRSETCITIVVIRCFTKLWCLGLRFKSFGM